MNTEKRVCVLYCVFVFFISVLCIRLYVLSDTENNEAVKVLDGQYASRITVAERSGFVYDRNINLLSHRKTGAVAVVNPYEITDAARMSDKLSEVALSASASEIYEMIMDGALFTFAAKDTEKTKKAVSEMKGVLVFDTYEENNETARHFLGYTNIDGKGMTGLRAHYNALLSEQLFAKASVSVMSDALRNSMSEMNGDFEKYISYDGIVTTLDADLQAFCDGFSDEIQSGAVVVADGFSGEILAMSSFPFFEAHKIADVLESDKGELVNRCTSSFSPGSVFKIVVAASALENDIGFNDYVYECKGSIEIDGESFSCHKKDGHGAQNLEEAFANSCNTYFVSLGKQIGLENITDMAKRLELDKYACADFVEENTNYFMKTKGNNGYLANISFGQGDLCLSPLDMTRIYMSAVDGYLKELSVIGGEIRDGKRILPQQKRKTRVFSPDTCEKLLSMMEKCVLYGTGKAAAVEDARVFGKTATAQTGRYNAEGVELVNKWFCGICNFEEHPCVVTVMTDFTTEKSLSPADVFSQIASYILERGSF